MIRKDSIIAILDLETAVSSQISKKLINNIYKSGKVRNISEEGKEKSFIITTSGYYLSPISSSTLLKRSSNDTDFYLQV